MDTNFSFFIFHLQLADELIALLAKGYCYYTDTNKGTLLCGIRTDVTNTEKLLYNSMKSITDFATILLIASYMLVVDWQLALSVDLIDIEFRDYYKKKV